MEMNRRTPFRKVVIWSHALLFVALIATLAEHIVTLARPLTYQHSWGAAGAMVEARSFRNEGILELRVVPMMNNPPFGLHPEAYVHWPPGDAIALTFWTSAFGESESSMHAYALLLYLVEATLLYSLVLLLMGPLAASIGTLAWLTFPVSLKYSHVLLNETTGIPFFLISAAALFLATERPHRRPLWVGIGTAATVLGTLGTWQGAFLPIGFIAASFWSRNSEHRKIAWRYLYFALGTVAAILVWYAVSYPSLFLDTLHTLTYRMGLSGSYSSNALHNDPSISQHLSIYTRIRLETGHLLRMVGGFGLTALVCACSTEVEHWREPMTRGPWVTIFVGLTISALLWYVTFSNHSAIHEFVFILLAPAASIAVAWCAIEALRVLGTDSIRGALLAVVGPTLLLIPLLQHLNRSVEFGHSDASVIPFLKPRPEIMQPDEFVQFGYSIREQTSKEAVVISPEAHLVPMYYSSRHIIGGVKTESELNTILPAIRREFPGNPVYLALFSKDADLFRGVLAAHSPKYSGGQPIVVRISQ
jgi:hypothetical protein